MAMNMMEKVPVREQDPKVRVPPILKKYVWDTIKKRRKKKPFAA